jgi:hypothetical protein
MLRRRLIASGLLVLAAFGISFALSSGGNKSDSSPFPGKRAATLNVPKSQLGGAKVGSDKAIPTLHAPAKPAPRAAPAPAPAPKPAPVTHRRAPAVSTPAPVRVTPAPAPVVHSPAPAPAPKPTTPSNGGNFDDSG